MSNHVTDWLNAYLDGELKGHRLHQVEAHLADCPECLAELESLQDVSDLLHEVPTPEFISSERFAAQVNLLLPHEQPRTPKRNVQEVGWWLIPVSLLMLWVFIGTSEAVGDVVRMADRFGLLSNAPAGLVQRFSGQAVWSDVLGNFGLLSGDGLAWAEGTELFTRHTLPQLVWQAAIAMLYLSWIVIWWARQRRRERG
ncbi:MAG TPA: zf-HC2 domain-containing protein [Anaerolineales bacterium]|nr:zf-HC2 domain-containing protein [Anaerolineales bacterium]